MNVRRRGFTLIEILVTIGIILVLVGIASVGITYVTKAGKNNATKVTLANLRGMIAELDASSGIKGRQPDSWYWGGVTVTPNPNAKGVWKDGNPSTVALEATPAPGGPVVVELSGSGTPKRYNEDTVANTQIAMGLLLQNPKNKTMIGQLPAEQLMEAIPAGMTTPKLTPAPLPADRRLNPPLPLDAWGNPIIMVPGAGLVVVVNKGNPASDPNPEQTIIVAPPDGQPFFASAGPDGVFSDDALTTADDGKDYSSDNVYSFEN